MDDIPVEDAGSTGDSSGSEVFILDSDSDDDQDVRIGLPVHLGDTEPMEDDLEMAERNTESVDSPDVIDMLDSDEETEDESFAQASTEGEAEEEDNNRPANPIPWHSPVPPPDEARTAPSSPVPSSIPPTSSTSQPVIASATGNTHVIPEMTVRTTGHQPAEILHRRNANATPGFQNSNVSGGNQELSGARPRPSTSAGGIYNDVVISQGARETLVHTGHDTSMEAFKSPKRYKVPTPTKQAPPPSPDKDEGSECPICFDQWSNSGEHRLSSLKCGHLFGFSCIDKWLKGQGGKCPQCNAKSTRKDIRLLYAKSLKTMDTTERDQALAALAKEKEARKRAEMEAAQARMRFQVAQDEVTKLRRELEICKQQYENARCQAGTLHGSQSTAASSTQRVLGGPKGYEFNKAVKIWDGGQCRVMCYSSQLATLVVSQPSSSPLFPGFGVKKVSALDFKTCQYVSIHQNIIRDVAFNPSTDDGILLSCGMDKTVKMTSLASNTVSLTYQCPMPVWSCTWNVDDPNQFFVGLQNGLVHLFDIRNTNGHIQHLNTNGPPVVSLDYLAQDVSSQFRPGGLVVGQLNKSTFFEKKTDGDYAPHILPMDGQLTCLTVEVNTRHLLASYRPTGRTPTTRHVVYELRSEGGAGTDVVCMANAVHTFHGGRTQKLLTRSRLLPQPSDSRKLMACAADEASQCINIWDTTSGEYLQKLPAQATILDICDIHIDGRHYLAGLTEKAVRLYSWSS